LAAGFASVAGAAAAEAGASSVTAGLLLGVAPVLAQPLMSRTLSIRVKRKGILLYFMIPPFSPVCAGCLLGSIRYSLMDDATDAVFGKAEVTPQYSNMYATNVKRM
jgi:hypothetical protein